MSRAHRYDSLEVIRNGVRTALPGATLYVYAPGTTTQLSVLTSAGVAVTQPLTTDANGYYDIYLTDPQFVDLAYSKTGYTSGTLVNVPVVLADTINIGASTIKYPGALGSDQFQLDAAVAGDAITLSAGGVRVFSARGVASAVNYVRAVNSVTGSPVLIDAQGTDTNIGLQINAKGTGSVAIRSNSLDALTVSGVASAVNSLTVTNAATGSNASIAATGSDTNIGINLKPKGTGTVAVYDSTGAKSVNLSHDGTNATLSTGNGRLLLSASDVTKNVTLYVGGLPVLEADGVASAVNGLTVTNAATGSTPSIAATGSDTNVGLDVKTKGTGRVRLFPGGTQHLDALYDGANLLLLPSAGLYIYSADQSKYITITNTTVSAIGASNFGTALATSLGGNTIAISSTLYINPAQSTAQANATENLRQLVMPRAGRIKNLYVQTLTAQGAGGSLVFTVRKNGVDTAITFTLAANAAAATTSDTTHTADFAVGDLLSIKVVNNDGAAVSAQIGGVSLLLDVPAS